MTARAAIRRRALLAVAFSAGVVSLGIAADAQAAYETVGSGVTKLTLDKGFLAGCKADGVKLSAVAPAKLSGGVFTVPAVGGKFDPVAAKGTVEGEGALVLSAGGRSIPLKSLKLRTTQKRSPFTAKVGGSQLKIATAGQLTVKRAGFDDKIAVSGLALSQTLATRLGKKLDLRQFFKAGLPLGIAKTVARPAAIDVVEKGRATLTLDPGFVAKLQSLFVAVNPIFPAEHQGPVFTLPIFGGTISPDARLGRLETVGALEFLQLGAGQIFWREPWLEFEAGTLSSEFDFQPSPPYPGAAGRVAVGAAALASPAVAKASARTVAAGFSLTLDAAQAQAFEEAFAKPQEKSGVFRAGEPFGTVSFTAIGQ